VYRRAGRPKRNLFLGGQRGRPDQSNDSAGGDLQPWTRGLRRLASSPSSTIRHGSQRAGSAASADLVLPCDRRSAAWVVGSVSEISNRPGLRDERDAAPDQASRGLVFCLGQRHPSVPLPSDAHLKRRTQYRASNSPYQRRLVWLLPLKMSSKHSRARTSQRFSTGDTFSAGRE